MLGDIDPLETQEWEASLDSLYQIDGPDRVQYVLDILRQRAQKLGLSQPSGDAKTPYINTLSSAQQAAYGGDLELEQHLEAILRWNAMMIVAAANHRDGSLGGHIGTFASSCMLYLVGFLHFFKASKEGRGDLVYYQGHASPGVYAWSYMSNILTEQQLNNFRREANGQGLSSYPHPWLMPNFWEFPTVSMGLGPLMAIYQAKLMKYLHNRGFAEIGNRKVWAFCGDGEMDEPESLGALLNAVRQRLDNLIFVVNCNLQRLDGLVNGNGKIIQDLEGIFSGAGWRVIKVIWGSNWDPILARDTDGSLQKAMMEACDGDFQTYRARGGAYMREHFFGRDPKLAALVAHLSDDEIHALLRGGHDPQKVYAAYQEAMQAKDQPTVVLVKTVKGYGMGAAGDSRNIAHNQKKLKVEELKYFRDFFKIPATDDDIGADRFLKLGPTEAQYLQDRRAALGGHLNQRTPSTQTLQVPHYQDFAKRLLEGTAADRAISTTTAFVQILGALCKDEHLGKFVVPVTPDESRTFGMEGLFRQLGIYHPEGQKYEPEDRQQVMWYKECKDGQILQEGINEAGAMSSWLAAAAAYANHHVPLIPFYIFYSMFGMQRVGDLVWLAGDLRARGFLCGATAGRTTLNGEGLQHQDGHSLVMAGLVPTCRSYDPTYAYELAVIIWHGLKVMYAEAQDIFFYITMMNENYAHRAMPEGCEAGIIKGLYLLEKAQAEKPKAHIQLLGSGTILKEVEAAQALLLEDFGVSSDVWSMTSSNELYREAKEVHRWNFLHPEAPAKVSYLETCLSASPAPILVATDYVKLYGEQLREFMPRPYMVLGTDGYGRSDTREALRRHFEVDRYYIVCAALHLLVKEGMMPKETLLKAFERYQIDREKLNPLYA